MTAARRRVLRASGAALLVAGVLVLLVCAYRLVGSGVEAGRGREQATEQLRQRWSGPVPTPVPGDPGAPGAPGAPVVDPATGDAFALLDLPRLGVTTLPVIEGVGRADLRRGVGHYPKTALPGTPGNVGIAGHRTTYGHPFADLDRLREGDTVLLTTQTVRYRYEVVDVRVVRPTAVWVLDPVPGRPGARPSEQLLTLTTCAPRWSSSRRLVVRAELVSAQVLRQGHLQAQA